MAYSKHLHSKLAAAAKPLCHHCLKHSYDNNFFMNVIKPLHSRGLVFDPSMMKTLDYLQSRLCFSSPILNADKLSPFLTYFPHYKYFSSMLAFGTRKKKGVCFDIKVKLFFFPDPKKYDPSLI